VRYGYCAALKALDRLHVFLEDRLVLCGTLKGNVSIGLRRVLLSLSYVSYKCC
jgi:hypothetical protein